MSSGNADILILSGLVSLSLFTFRVKQCVPLHIALARLFQHTTNTVTTITPSISTPTLTVTPATSPTMLAVGGSAVETAVDVGKMRSVFVGVRLEIELVCSE